MIRVDTNLAPGPTRINSRKSKKLTIINTELWLYCWIRGAVYRRYAPNPICSPSRNSFNVLVRTGLGHYYNRDCLTGKKTTLAYYCEAIEKGYRLIWTAQFGSRTLHGPKDAGFRPQWWNGPNSGWNFWWWVRFLNIERDNKGPLNKIHERQSRKKIFKKEKQQKKIIC